MDLSQYQRADECDRRHGTLYRIFGVMATGIIICITTVCYSALTASNASTETRVHAEKFSHISQQLKEIKHDVEKLLDK